MIGWSRALADLVELSGAPEAFYGSPPRSGPAGRSRSADLFVLDVAATMAVANGADKAQAETLRSAATAAPLGLGHVYR